MLAIKEVEEKKEGQNHIDVTLEQIRVVLPLLYYSHNAFLYGCIE